MKVISATYKAGLAGLAVLSVLCIHTGAARAQQGAAEAAPPPADQPAAPAPPQAQPQYQQAPQPYPPGYGPPPGYNPPQGYGTAPPTYGAPPPRYSYYPPPPPPVASRSGIDRTFTIGGSLGLGAMHYYEYALDASNTNQSASGPATGYSARLGFGVAPRLLLLLGVDGAVSVANDYVYDQSIYYIGLQAFLTHQLFLRGGAGIGNITSRQNGDFLRLGKTGLGLTGTVGVEILQGYNWSLELAGLLTSGFYSDEKWTSGTIQIGFNFF